MTLNRAILMTPPGVAAIAVVRLSGAGVVEFLRSHFSSPLRPMAAIHGLLRDDAGDEIDDPVVVVSSDERSADINLHGGAWVVQAVLDLAKSAGFELVEPIELPLPDEAIDATDPIEREVLAYLPLATTDLALRTLLAQREAWRELHVRINLLQISTHEPSTPSPRNTGEREHASGPALEITAILADHALHWLLHPPRVAIVGAANVGKSTLANRLFAQERSITADVPGTTRDWVGEMANLDGLAVQLVDTPGIRDTVDAIEREAIERAGTQIQRADLVVLVLDASRSLAPEQATLLERFPDALRVANKVDATHAWEVGSIDAIHTIATTGQGVDDLMRRIRQYFGCEGIAPNRVRCWTPRQRVLLSNLKSEIPNLKSEI